MSTLFKPGNLATATYSCTGKDFIGVPPLRFFFLSVTLLMRAWIPGASIQFTKGLFYISTSQLLSTAFIASGIGRIFVKRYGRFADYRITRAVLAALVHENPTNGHASNETKPPASV
jgi:hypothetical protein